MIVWSNSFDVTHSHIYVSFWLTELHSLILCCLFEGYLGREEKCKYFYEIFIEKVVIEIFAEFNISFSSAQC